MTTLVKSRFTIRLAENGEGDKIAALLRKDWLETDAADFQDIYPFWLIAVADHDIPEPTGDYSIAAGQIIGCIQIVIGKPFGFAEFLATDPDLSPHARARVVRMLLIQAFASLGVHGCKFGMGNVPFAHKSYKRALKKRSGRVAWQGNTLITRLA